MNMKHARCVSFMMTATAYNANYASAVYYVRALLALGRPATRGPGVPVAGTRSWQRDVVR